MIATCGFHHSIEESGGHMLMPENIFWKRLFRPIFVDEIKGRLLTFSMEIFSTKYVPLYALVTMGSKQFQDFASSRH
jgi:hypothetical protein